MRILIISILSFFIISCAAGTHISDLYKYTKPVNKIILAPVENKHALKEIKDLFRQNGWKVIVEDKSIETTEISENNRKRVSTEVKLAEFKLYYDSSIVLEAFCTNSSKDLPLDYSLSIVDYRTGEEVYSARGRGCIEDEIIPKVKKDLSEFIK